MNRWFYSLLALILFALATGCSGTNNPVSPAAPDNMLELQQTTNGTNSTHLWGLYTCSFNPDTLEMEVTPFRAPMFTANVTNFINGSMVGIGFDIDGIETGPDFIDVDVDIVLTHPFPGMPHYNG